VALRTAGLVGWRRVLRDLVCTEQLADTRSPERPEWRCVTVIRAPATNGVAVETVAWGVRPARAGGCRGTPAQLLSMDARVLAAADIYQALVSDRPHPTRRVGFPAGLTGREVEVLRLLVRGRSERQIAAELFIAASTVHTHITHLFDRAGVSTRAGAAVFAMEHGLIHPAPAT
jgi:DNA-binding NarL/FixJ family response regulator